MIAIPIILGILLFISILVIRNLYKSLTNILKENETMYDVVGDITKKMTVAYNNIKVLDHKGHYESDDEVGAFFKVLKSNFETLTLYLQEIDNENKQ